MEPDHYHALGLTPQASPQEIRAAYLLLAKRFHPDVSTDPHAQQHFQAILAAYQVLKDPDRRNTYDLTRELNQAKAGLAAYRQQQAERRAQHRRRRGRNLGLGNWWR